MTFEELNPIGILKIHMTLTYSPGDQRQHKSASFFLNVLLSIQEENLDTHCLEHNIKERVDLIHLLGEYRYFTPDDRMSRIISYLITKLMDRIMSLTDSRVHDDAHDIAHHGDDRYWQTYQQIERIATTESFRQLFNKPGDIPRYRALDLSQIQPAAYHSGGLSMNIDQVWASVEHKFVDDIFG